MRELVPTPLIQKYIKPGKCACLSVKSKLEDLRDYKVASVIPDKFNFLLLFGFQ